MVGDDHLIHALKIIDADQRQGFNLQAGFFRDLAGGAFLGRFSGFHEAGDEAKPTPWPGRVVGQKQLSVPIRALHHGRQYRGWVVPDRPTTGWAAQAIFVSAILKLGMPDQRRGAMGAKSGVVLHLWSSFGRHLSQFNATGGFQWLVMPIPVLTP